MIGRIMKEKLTQLNNNQIIKSSNKKFRIYQTIKPLQSNNKIRN